MIQIFWPNLKKHQGVTSQANHWKLVARPHSFSEEEPLQKKWLIKQGNKAQTAICNFAVYLMSTQHPHNPDHTDWIKPTLPLCKKHHEDV